MQKRRLMKLAKMLLEDAKKENGIKFDIGTVGRSSDGINPFVPKQVVALDCGTTACAMGLAAISGAFKKEGLGYKINPYTLHNQIVPKWNGRALDYDQAAMKLFNITKEQANYLFSPWTYPLDKRREAKGEREVVRRIKRVVAGKIVPKDIARFILMLAIE